MRWRTPGLRQSSLETQPQRCTVRLSRRWISISSVVATRLDGVILRPYYPASKLYRIMAEDMGITIDFMPVIHGISSFNSLRSRASSMELEGNHFWIASLEDIIASKKAAARPRDKASLPALERTLREKAKAKK